MSATVEVGDEAYLMEVVAVVRWRCDRRVEEHDLWYSQKQDQANSEEQWCVKASL
jgi:hypothetical protein